MIPNTDTNRDFQWNDKLVSEFVGTLLDQYHKGHSFNSALKIFKSSCLSNVGVDWEIETFKNNKGEVGYPFPYQVHNGIWVEKTKWVEFWLNQKEYSIHSVRRVSDQSVWTASDEVYTGSSSEDLRKHGKIISFQVEGNEMCVFIASPLNKMLKYFLGNLKKPDKPVPQPLLNEKTIVKYIVIGIATGSGEIESWGFDNLDYCKKFCKRLVRSTGHNVWIVQGSTIGHFEPDVMPVKFIEKK